MAPTRTDERLDIDDDVTLPERYHMEGCPAPEGRVEQYRELKPAQPAKGIPAQPVLITRCVQCGGQSVKEVDA